MDVGADLRLALETLDRGNSGESVRDRQAATGARSAWASREARSLGNGIVEAAACLTVGGVPCRIRSKGLSISHRVSTCSAKMHKKTGNPHDEATDKTQTTQRPTQ